MKTIICKATGEKYYGKVVSDIKKVVRLDGAIIDLWVFEVDVDGSILTWECHSDYWDLVDSDLRKVGNALRINESQEFNVLEKIKKIIKWGFCKEVG